MSHGTGALHWSLSPVSSTTPFPQGLAINADTGVISGTANFSGTASFVAQVNDSASPPRTASKIFAITAFSPLTTSLPQSNLNFNQFQAVSFFPNVQGGVPPISYGLSRGALPPNLQLNAATGEVSGKVTVPGTYQFSVTIQDSFSPPEIVVVSFTVTVSLPALSVENSLPSQIPVNVPFSGAVVANGGAPPYTFAITSGSLPPGLTLERDTGKVTGAPSLTGSYGFNVKVTDSAANVASLGFAMTVIPQKGRNDTIQGATAIGNGGFSASISPYIDPPAAGSNPGDSDYYKLRAIAGAVVHVETNAKRNNPNTPLDTVMEIVDGNGVRLTTCNQPEGTSTNFTSVCLNDDLSASPHIQDSKLDLQVNASATTFYVRVLDWRGDARPDMGYFLNVSGVIDPVQITTTFLPNAIKGFSYNQQLSATGGLAPITWSVISGNLPPGLSLTSGGAINGTPTTTGTYSFTVQAADSDNPPQTATGVFTIRVDP